MPSLFAPLFVWLNIWHFERHYKRITLFKTILLYQLQHSFESQVMENTIHGANEGNKGSILTTFVKQLLL